MKGNREMKRIACLFPGIGYTCDKPLMYYCGRLLKGLGWEVVQVPYSGFPDRVKGDRDKTQRTIEMALEQAAEMLKGIDWNGYDDILFVGKSLGTIVCAAYAERYGVRCRRVIFTPVEASFQFSGRPEAIAFHGTADSWVDTGTVEDCCFRQGIPLYETEGANHSLETGDVDQDIRELRKVMKTIRKFAERD